MEPMQPIHWYPGHMAKAKRELEELIKYLDIIIEVRDARIPETSHNRDLDYLLRRRPVVIALNKADLANPEITKKWVQFLEDAGVAVVTVNGQTGKGLEAIWEQMQEIMSGKKRVGTAAWKAAVVGIPNVGKSSILNRLLGTGVAKTGNKPGVTRGKQWVRRHGFEILDTPGLLPPRLTDGEEGKKLALTGAVKEELIPVYDLALLILEDYAIRLPEKVDTSSPEEILVALAKRRGFLLKGGAPDVERAAITLLREFRNGKLGPVSLEVPVVENAG